MAIRADASYFRKTVNIINGNLSNLCGLAFEGNLNCYAPTSFSFPLSWVRGQLFRIPRELKNGSLMHMKKVDFFVCHFTVFLNLVNEPVPEKATAFLQHSHP